MELDRTGLGREKNRILCWGNLMRNWPHMLFSTHAQKQLWEWGWPRNIPLRSKGASFFPSPFWTCLSLLLQRVPAEEITYETLKKAIGKTAAPGNSDERGGWGWHGPGGRSWWLLVNSSATKAAAGSPHSLMKGWCCLSLHARQSLSY